MTKKWVFNSLVLSEQDSVGLIAYALYKKDKHALAADLRNSGNNEESIQQQVDTFHDHAIQQNRLNGYRERATTYLDALILEAQEMEAKKNAAETVSKIAKLEKQHKNDLASQRRKILKNMNAYQASQKNWLDKLIAWLLSGIPGVVSGFLVSAFIIGASILLVSENKRQEVFSELVADYLGVQTKPSGKTGP